MKQSAVRKRFREFRSTAFLTYILAGALLFTFLPVGGALGATVPDLPGSAYREDFNQDVFQNNSWDRTNSSVAADSTNGWLHIGAGNGVNDGAKHDVSYKLPITVESRMRLVSSGANYKLPYLMAYFVADTSTIFPNWKSGQPINGDAIITTYLSGYGWGLGPEKSGNALWNGNNDRPITAENQWATLRVTIRQDGGELKVKRDSDPDFQTVATRTWSIPDTVTSIATRQPWDAVCDLDYVSVAYDNGFNTSNPLLDNYLSWLSGQAGVKPL